MSARGSAAARRVLVVEDEEDLARTLVYNLEREGHRARSAGSAADALRAAAASPPPDLVILDLTLPDLSGTELCRRLRADPRTARIPILMLTARGEEADRVLGFEVGADDYVVKPFSPRELLLRVRALLRRSADTDRSGDAVRYGRIRLDPGAHQAWVGDREIQLTALEFRLLHTLLVRRGRVQTRDRLLEDVWGTTAEVTTRTVDTHVKRLREKLGDAGAYVETLRGVGYRIPADPPKAPR